MDLINKLSKADVKELFSKNWKTHDAMCYGNCMHELGPEQTNRLNKSAVRLMAAIEIKRIVKLMGKPKDFQVQNLDELAEIIATAFQMEFDWENNLSAGVLGSIGS